MPSDLRVVRALETLAVPIEQYRSAVAMTLEEVRGHVAAGRSDAEASAMRLQQQLGAFADARLDATRLAALLDDRQSLDTAARQRLERAADVLHTLVHSGDDLFQVTVAAGTDLYGCVSARLATIGRAFSAARIAAAANNGGAASGLDEHAALGAFPYAEWNAAERQLAPPLVVTVNGADLVAGALAPFLDGTQKIVLIIDGPCAPAPLVRLITPGVLVIQAHDLNELEIMRAWRGPAVGALVPTATVRFVHDPAAGPEAWRRISMQSAGESRLPRIGGVTAAQQSEELRQLESLAAPPPAMDVAAIAPDAVAPGDPTDRLAAWLLHQANLPAIAIFGD